MWSGIPVCLALAGLVLTSSRAGESTESLSTKNFFVEGKSVDENETRAQELAIAIALRAAVEKAVVSDPSFARDAASHQVLTERILPNAADYIQSFQLIPGSYRRVANQTQLSLQVKVRLDDLERDLRNLDLIRKQWSPPRVAFILKEEIDRQRSDFRIFAAELQHVLAQGPIVISPEFDFDEAVLRERRGFEEKERLRIGFQQQVDFLIRGEAIANYAGAKMIAPLPDSQHYYHANVWAEVIRSDNGQVLALQSLDEVRAASIKSRAAGDALRRAARKLADSILDQLSRQWEQEFVLNRRLELQIYKLPPTHLATIASALLELPGVLNVDLRYYESDAAFFIELRHERNVALFDVEFRGPFRKFYEAVQNLRALKLRLERLASNRLEFVYGESASDTVKFEVNAPAVEIDSLFISDLFPAQLIHHTRHPVGYARIRNNSLKTYQSLKFSVYIPEAMSLPSDTTLAILRPAQVLEIPFTIPLAAHKLKDLQTDVIAQSKIEVIYFEQGKERKRTLSRPVRIFNRNAMDWRIEESVGAFIEPENPTIMNLAARFLQQAVLPEAANPLHKTYVLWEGLRAMNLQYRSDPYTTYKGITNDRVKTPVEVLKDRAGDCDDLSVLFVSCLESQGISTALALTPNHIFPMFNTGLTENQWHQLGVPRDQLVEWQNQIWIPIEATSIAEDFKLAWSKGKQVFSTYAELGDLTILDTEQILKAYPPACLFCDQKIDLTFSPPSSTKMLVFNDFAPDSNRKAHLLAMAGKLDEARRIYLGLVRQDSTNANVVNNLGNVYLMLGFTDSALFCYDRALAYDPIDTTLFFNMAVALDLVVAEMETSAERRSLEAKMDTLFDILVTSPKALNAVQKILGEDSGIRAAKPDDDKKREAAKARIQKKVNDARKRGGGGKNKSKTGGARSRNIPPPKNTIYVYWKFV